MSILGHHVSFIFSQHTSEHRDFLPAPSLHIIDNNTRACHTTVNHHSFIGNGDSHANWPPYALHRKARATRTKLTNQIYERLHAGARRTKTSQPSRI